MINETFNLNAIQTVRFLRKAFLYKNEQCIYSLIISCYSHC